MPTQKAFNVRLSNGQKHYAVVTFSNTTSVLMITIDGALVHNHFYENPRDILNTPVRIILGSGHTLSFTPTFGLSAVTIATTVILFFPALLALEGRQVRDWKCTWFNVHENPTQLMATATANEALKQPQRALVIQAQKANNSLRLAVTCNNIGLVFWQTGDFNGALKQYQRALVIQAKKAPNSSAVAATYNNIGALLKKGRRERSLEAVSTCAGD
jgi:tetratricopeptide (TPR) repeat protein